ncbi:neuronal PAS domain-containing protein 2-like isoform X2 [Trichoplusia ni]|uniref:Neuronal PAS domain-containing protein 2-like isoform X2 n=1 Tax=Trichoplusia ni TaxID=7111 RepID=A0A7E5VHN6_TRINI|nr:neuronal PAS domain-containing protein 2-like isoform X2 [Trichoplusia ni]
MAETQSHTPGVIRSTRDYLQVPESPAPASPEDSEEARTTSPISTLSGDDDSSTVSTTRDNPREMRNKAEKMRRDRLNQSVAELAAMVPPVVAARRKIDKTTVLRLTAHYLRAHQYVFGDSIEKSAKQFNPASVLKVLSLFNGFLITTTYRGIIVVVSQNVNQYLGYSELDLLGQNLLNITHEDDRALLKDQLMPKSQTLGPNGELVIPDEPNALRKVKKALAQEKKRFIVRLRKMGQRSEPRQYVTCHIEGSLRKSDRACRGYNRCCQMVRRARARCDNPCASGNDIVFIGIVRPTSETFINESALESYRMEYRTRHSIDGEIIQCESRIALVTGYMTHEVSGVNAMNFMHRDDVRWVIIALREMYDQHRLFGESCYRLMTKNGQFIYMRTRGRLDVDQDSRAVTSFVCTNTVVTEQEGRHLIKMMRRKFTMMVNNAKPAAIEEIEDDIKTEDEINDNQPAPVEDPRRLEQVILHLVTNLPSPPPDGQDQDPFTAASPEKSMSPTHRLTIIPPNKERIVSAIEKIYSVIKTFPRDNEHESSAESTSSDVEPAQLARKPMSITEIPSTSNATNLLPAPEPQVLVPYQNQEYNCVNYAQALEPPAIEPIAYNGNCANEFNTDDIFNAGSSPDLGYFDASPSTYSNMSSIFANINQNGEEIIPPSVTTDFNEFNYEVPNSSIDVPLPSFDEESSEFQALNGFACGTKRPREFEEMDITYKKKITENLPEDFNLGLDSPTLDQLFDETIFNSQIESAIDSLDNIDPTFPGLLTPTEIQGILGELEKDAELEQLNFNGTGFE